MSTSMQFEDYIVEHESVISKDVCADIIERFEKDDRSYPGVVGAQTLRTELKISTDLFLSSLSDWQDIDKILYDALAQPVSDYIQLLTDNERELCHGKIDDSGYQIQKSAVGGKYDWHTDDYATVIIPDDLDIRNTPRYSRHKVKNQRRIATYIFYLNDYGKDFDGGRTQFKFGAGEALKSVEPSAGKLVIFPASQNYIHRGEKVTRGNKYLITGWVRDYGEEWVII